MIKRYARVGFQQATSRVPMLWADRVMRNAVSAQRFEELSVAQEFGSRERLWKHLFTDILDPSAPVSYLEFGVFEGASINAIAGMNTHADSWFIGFDTFEGIDVDWITHDMRGFDRGGRLPNTSDDRITLVKGIFQDTLEPTMAGLTMHDQVVVMLDADLYSSTLYALTRLDTHLDGYHAIFDEFHGGENLALANYADSYQAKVRLIGKATGAATQVLATIDTHRSGAD